MTTNCCVSQALLVDSINRVKYSPAYSIQVCHSVHKRLLCGLFVGVGIVLAWVTKSVKALGYNLFFIISGVDYYLMGIGNEVAYCYHLGKAHVPMVAHQAAKHNMQHRLSHDGGMFC
jgi:hypothetical protein